MFKLLMSLAAAAEQNAHVMCQSRREGSPRHGRHSGPREDSTQGTWARQKRCVPVHDALAVEGVQALANLVKEAPHRRFAQGLGRLAAAAVLAPLQLVPQVAAVYVPRGDRKGKGQ